MKLQVHSVTRRHTHARARARTHTHTRERCVRTYSNCQITKHHTSRPPLRAPQRYPTSPANQHTPHRHLHTHRCALTARYGAPKRKYVTKRMEKQLGRVHSMYVLKIPYYTLAFPLPVVPVVPVLRSRRTPEEAHGAKNFIVHHHARGCMGVWVRGCADQALQSALRPQHTQQAIMGIPGCT